MAVYGTGRFGVDPYGTAGTPAGTAIPFVVTVPAGVGGRWPTSLPGTYAPALWLRLGELSGTTAADSSGNGRDGTIASSGVTYNAGGLVVSPADGAMTFAATDGYVTVPNLSTVLAGSSAALFAWVTFPNNPADFSAPLGIRGAGDVGFYFSRQTGTNQNLLDVHFKATPTGIDLGTQMQIAIGVPQWIGAVYRRDRGVLEGYVNGKLVNIARNAGATNLTLPNGLRLQVGRTDYQADNGTNNQFIWSQGCTVDEVLAWNRAPTAAEVWDLYQAGLNQSFTRNTFALLDTSRWYGMHLNGNFDEYSANTTQDAANADLATAPIQVAHTFRAWADPTGGNVGLRGEALNSMRGALPLVTWEPWDVANGSVTQSTYTLTNIASGNFDTSVVLPFAAEVKAYGGELLIRFAHEMNGGGWYPWQPGYNSNASGASGGVQYVAAYKHVYDTLMAQLSSQQQQLVRWVWCVSNDNSDPSSGWTRMADCYPTGSSSVTGREYVDYVAIDGYNYGTDNPVPRQVWDSASAVFGATYARLAALAPNKLQFLGETGSSETGGSKAAWITDLFTNFVITQCPLLRGVVWFNLNKERDWRYNSTTAARNALAAAITPTSQYYAPQIRNPQVGNVTATSAIVQWTSDVPGNGVVDYGPTTGYGSVANDNAFSTSHLVTLTGLTPGQPYHARVSSSR